MFTLYLFALIVGGGLLVASLIGASEGHDGGLGHDVDASHDVPGANPVQWLSFRTLVYFLFVFGGVGTILSKGWPGGAAPVVFGLSVASGLGIGAVVAATFGYLRKTDSGVRQSEDSFVGLAGRMTLPFSGSGSGKVLVARGDRTFELLARPFGTTRGDPTSWKAVVVVEMQRGTALVAPSDDAAVRELSQLNP